MLTKSEDLDWDLKRERLTWPHQRPEPLEIPQSLLLKKKKEKKENTKRQRSKHKKGKNKQ